MLYVEGSTLELKSKVTDDICKTIVAFANTQGGTIYIGIENDGKAIGVDKIEDEMLKVSNMVRDSIKPDVTMFTSISTVKEQGENIIKIKVQKGSQNPYYLRNKGLRPEGVYVRHGASSAPASESAIRRMIKEADGDSYEKMRSLNQDLTFLYSEAEFQKRGVAFDENHMKTLQLLNEDSIFTNLALLLSDQCSHKVKAAVFEGTSKSIFKDRREFTGSLLKQLSDAYAYLNQYNKIRAEFDGLYRTDKRDYPEDALREALLNAIVHRDYSYSADILISIFDNRLELISVGGLVKGVTLPDIMLGLSITRNKGLAAIFYRLNFIEAYGTGIPKILDAYKGLVRQPSIEATDNAFKIVLPNCNELSKEMQLTDQEQKVIDLISIHGKINRRLVEERLGVSQTMAGRILKNMVDMNIIAKKGQGKNTVYNLK